MDALTVEETAARIADMRIRGAGRIARSAALALGHFAGEYRGREAEAFRKALEAEAARLLATRPTAISLSNAIGLVCRGAKDVADAREARLAVMEAARRFAEDADEAVERVAEVAAARVPKGATVLTHCNSSAAVAAIVRAHDAGGARAYCTETRPWRQGRITARELESAGVPVTLIVDSAVGYVMDGVDIVLVGADTIEWDGSLLNKVGTLQVACAAKRCGKPFVCCAESYKFAPPSHEGRRRELELRDASEVLDGQRMPGVKVLNPVFDRTPPELVTTYATEHGECAPAKALAFAKEYLEGL
jgi:ribose 1,5-bisphosphate isomerase